jgi:phosphotransacetylase
MEPEILNNMMSRVERCRILARETSDERVARALLQMAEEGQADLELLYRRKGPPSS